MSENFMFFPPRQLKFLIVRILVSQCQAYSSDSIYILGAIFILHKDLGVGGWSRKWQFSFTLCIDNVLCGWFKKASKHPYVT